MPSGSIVKDEAQKVHFSCDFLGVVFSGAPVSENSSMGPFKLNEITDSYKHPCLFNDPSLHTGAA